MENIVLGDHTLSIEDLAQLIANEKATMKTIALNNKKLLFITLKN
jgi:hypothetical protein